MITYSIAAVWYAALFLSLMFVSLPLFVAGGVAVRLNALTKILKSNTH